MSEAYRVKKFHHVTNTKQKRLRSENLIPILDQFPEQPLLDSETDVLMSSPAAMKLKITDFDRLEDQLEVIMNIQNGDWLIEYPESGTEASLMKVISYRHLPHKHLYIKHFAEISHTFSVQKTHLPSWFSDNIDQYDHLKTLPLSVAGMLEKYEALIEQAERNRIARLNEQAKKEDKQKSKPRKKKIVRKFAKQSGPIKQTAPVIIKRVASSSKLEDIELFKKDNPGVKPTIAAIQSWKYKKSLKLRNR